MSVENSPFKVDHDNYTVASVPENKPLPPAAIDSKYDKSIFCTCNVKLELKYKP